MFKEISNENNFTLFANEQPYRIYQTDGYIINNQTKQNCGSRVVLYKRYHNNGLPLDEPIYDEDCYTVVGVQK